MRASNPAILDSINNPMDYQRTRKFLRAVETITKHKGSYIPCPDCSGEGGMSWVCEMCGGEGCRHCNLGMVLLPCNTCKGRKQVYKVDDEIEEVW